MNMTQKRDNAAHNGTDNDEPPSSSSAADDQGDAPLPVAIQVETSKQTATSGGIFGRIKYLLKGKNGNGTSGSDALREAIEEYIEEHGNGNEPESSVAAHEKALLSNILELRDMSVQDVMIPRADIIAVDIETSQEDLLKLLSERQHSRLPVYRNSLDDVVGTIHIKDILATLAAGKNFVISELTRDVPIISPSMHVLDLLLMMRQMRKHMALVVDEFGGIDGLIAVGDVIEAIIGDIDDEYDHDDDPVLIESKDGTLLVDGRYDIDEFEEEYGEFLNEEEREDIDTLGGFVFAISGRIPARGEIIHHEESGMVFEIVDADPRRINRIRVKNLPSSYTSDTI